MFLPKNLPEPLAMFIANCNARNDLPIPPTAASTPGVAKGIKRSTKNCTGGGSPTNDRISYRLIPIPPPSISSLTASIPRSRCKSLKSPCIDGNLIMVLCKLLLHSVAFFCPTPLASLSNAKINLALLIFLNLVKASKPKLALNTTSTACLVAMCKLTPVATPSHTSTLSSSPNAPKLKPIGNTFPLISDDDTKRFRPFLSIYCKERNSPSIA